MFTQLSLKKALIALFCLPIVVFGQISSATKLKLTDFAIWGGSAAPASLSSGQGVFINTNTTITGNIGSNQYLDLADLNTYTGDLYSGNTILMRGRTTVNGSVLAANLSGQTSLLTLEGRSPVVINGSIRANGRVSLKLGTVDQPAMVTGTVAVPPPTSTNYSGPVPQGGFSTNLTFPASPTLPALANLGNTVGTPNVGATATLQPGKYGRMLLNGKATITFSGPGNYIFDAIANQGENTFIFDLKNTTQGTINIFVIGNATMGALSVRSVQVPAGGTKSRIFTEVHGTGGTVAAFDVSAPSTLTSGNFVWLGNVWAPNGSITIRGLKSSSTPHIIGALWSNRSVQTAQNLRLTYQAPPDDAISYVNPYYPPPNNGKVDPPNNIIGAELTSLVRNFGPISSIPENEIYIFDDADRNKVYIEVVSKTRKDLALAKRLVDSGMTNLIDNGPHEFVITGSYPISKLTGLNNMDDVIEYVRPLFPPLTNRGGTTTQGDKTMRSDFVRQGWGLQGTGVKVGVISDSYNKKGDAPQNVNEGDLPGPQTDPIGEPNENLEPVQVAAEFGRSGGSDEGRAMLQIVHDIAPMSKLAFRTGFMSAGDFANGIKQLADPALPGGKCDVIVDDITYITEPFLRDGIVANTVDEVVGQGVSYFTSAGNFGEKSHEDVFRGVPNTSFPLEAGAQIHQFGPNSADIYQTLQLKPGSYTIVLQWDDGFHSLGEVGGQTDLDLYIANPNGFQLFGFNRSNIFKDPFEVCPFTVSEETTAKLIVVRASGTANVRFKYVIFRGSATIADFKLPNPSTIVGHANANGAVSVGAMLYDKFPNINPNWPDVASFSSRGGTGTLKIDELGARTFPTRNKPDIVGPNGVNTTVTLGGATFYDGDTYPNFFGTSAAAPHVAAVGALLIEGRKKFNLQETVTPAEIRQQLISTAGKFEYLGSPDFSFIGGNGFTQADKAALVIANPKPIAETLTAVVAGAENGTQPFTVKITGKYFMPDATIRVGVKDYPAEISADGTVATAEVPALNGINLPFRVNNPFKSPSKIDGGLSKPLFFFGGNTINVQVKALNKTRKYKQENPPFDAEVFVNGIPIEQTKLFTREQLTVRDEDLVFTTLANRESKAGNYSIIVRKRDPIDPNNELLSLVELSFVRGTLTIEKLPVKVTPKDITIQYGQFPEGIDYTYELPTEFAGDADLLAEIRNIHRQYIPENGVALLNGFEGNALGVTLADFENKAMVASFQSLLSARKLQYENGVLKPIAGNLDISALGNQRFLVDIAAASMANYKTNPAQSPLVPSYNNAFPRALLNLKEFMKGSARVAVTNDPLVPIINGQLQGVVNGQLQAAVNSELEAMVNGVYETAQDITFLNGQLQALISGVWTKVTNARQTAEINGTEVVFTMSVQDGELVALALVNDQLMPVVNGQLVDINGQLVAVVNGQLQAVINGQLVPIINGQLVSMVNEQLQPIINGQLVALINGQLYALVNDVYQVVEGFGTIDGQLVPIINEQLTPIVKTQLQAMVNGTLQPVELSDVSLINGQLQVIVNGQLTPIVNGQLTPIVNSQLTPIVNGEGVVVNNVSLVNGQLVAVVNSTQIPIPNGQLQSIVNGQLLSMVNGQLMAVVNGQLTFVVFKNDQLQAVVNEQLTPIVNAASPTEAFVNGQLLAVVNGVATEADSYSIANGQLQVIVNGVDDPYVYTNDQLTPIVNGQLLPVVNNIDISGDNNNAGTMLIVDQNDVDLQSGNIGNMYALPMVTGLNATGTGVHKIIPAALLNDNLEVTYGLGNMTVSKTPVIVKAKDVNKVYGSANPALEVELFGLAFNEQPDFALPVPQTGVVASTVVGVYPITLTIDPNVQSLNYDIIYENGLFSVTRAPLTIKAKDQTITQGSVIPALEVEYIGLVNGDLATSICASSLTVPSPLAIVDNTSQRTTVYSNLAFNGTTTNVFQASPGQTITITGNRDSRFNNPNPTCPSCTWLLRIGMANLAGTANVFTTCYTLKANVRWQSTINITFTAPTQPGVYPITQIMEQQNSCADASNSIHNNEEATFAYVVVDNVAGASSLQVTTTATPTSPTGDYPIILSGCSFSNPNYDVTLQNGTLTIVPADAITVAQASETAPQAAVKETDGNYPVAVNTIFPNPAQNTIRYVLESEPTHISGIQVMSTAGKMQPTTTRKLSERFYETNISALPKGMYFLKANTISGVKTLKFVKM